MSSFNAVENRFFLKSRPEGLEPPDPGILAFHRALPGYAPTPLRSLPALADALSIGNLLVKDESQRFGLGSFKVLGASYGIFRFLQQASARRGLPMPDPRTFVETGTPAMLGRMTFATATDGNHGRAVAWTARMLHQRAVIFVPEHTVRARIEAIKAEGAQVVVVDGSYDEAVQRAEWESRANGWQVIADTGYDDYMDVPTWIASGYSTIFGEVEAQRIEAGIPAPDVVLVQAGVGGLAAGAVQYYFTRPDETPPRLVCVEPTDADCLLESASHDDGEPHASHGALRSIMAGLNCGVPSRSAWPLIRYGISAFLALDDAWAEEAMRQYHRPHPGDPRITSGESGAAGLAGLLAMSREAGLEPLRQRLGLNRGATVLLINTEGATDPEGYQRVVGEAPLR